ncbi:hypothetical protein [Streptomyces sp. NPDC088725]|uniref:hypothetical protein n=1 Tax=Streptomyces sp. NPDC088725 TaxID=3365873 RepID=UPI00382F667C
MNTQPTPPGLCIGMVVYDRSYDMVGVVDDFAGPLVNLSRPTGLTWTSRWASVRAGTEYERRQLRAIAELHKLRHKGLIVKPRTYRPGP